VRSRPQPRAWRDTLVQGAALKEGAYGCALGNVVVEPADQDEQARTARSGHFATWEALPAAEFRRMQDDRGPSRHGSRPGPNSSTSRTRRGYSHPYSLQPSFCASASASKSPAKAISTTMSGDAPTAGTDSLSADCFINCAGATAIDEANEGSRQLMLRRADYDQAGRSQFPTQR
jgi:hypothetical protein